MCMTLPEAVQTHQMFLLLLLFAHLEIFFYRTIYLLLWVMSSISMAYSRTGTSFDFLIHSDDVIHNWRVATESNDATTKCITRIPQGYRNGEFAGDNAGCKEDPEYESGIPSSSFKIVLSFSTLPLPPPRNHLSARMMLKKLKYRRKETASVERLLAPGRLQQLLNAKVFFNRQEGNPNRNQ